MKYSKIITRKTSLWLLLATIILLTGSLIKDHFDYVTLEKLFADVTKIPGDSWDEQYKDVKIKDKYKVVYIPTVGGEHSAAKYFQHAAEKIGWEVKIYPMTIQGKEDEIISFNPDFIIGTFLNTTDRGFLDTLLQYKKYYWISMPIKSRIKKSLDTVLKTDARLWYIVYSGAGMLSCPEEEIGLYKIMWNKLNKPFYGIKFLPLPPSNDYEPAEPKRVFWGGVSGDGFRFSQRYKSFITLLSQKVPIKVYGPRYTYHFLESKLYGGYIPPGLENIEAIRKNGIYLVSHQKAHFDGNVPSMKPFEAAAANVITISDMHPFVMKHFGDSMLYFDHNASPEEMYRQVEKHVSWILENPDRAKEMANRAHQIFLEKFTVDQDLIRIAKMHEYILTQEKQMNLEYPFSYGDVCN
ncbi:hypothetical protein phytr_4020 [Candidatus Phycorickettsia trachydisci]|uniref:Spore protein YkvP/CgeB glycosyl transferase-like domain-containing protein n=1 Tax=Candidatus Phycorickettsia trachydisci TaxID=2115978 RepID=A0A2P1P7W3_9RICK|nr:glycosyltransferase [Candidatus Phycorickettsia trachydisci]AVP87353.1 hypothetical protein phytr_4020 [Candidatus Phycorickettsia trachydisci]